MKPVIVWFRHDLRLADQPAIRAAADSGAPVICIYILDEESPGLRSPGGASRWWLHHSLTALKADIDKAGARLHILRGPAGELVPAIARAANAAGLYWTRRYDGPGVAIDRKLKETLREQDIAAKSYNGQLLNEPWTIETKSGGPYAVFTPYWKAVRAGPEPDAPLPRVTKIEDGVWPRGAPQTVSLEDLELLPVQPDWARGLRDRWTPGEAGARTRLKDFLDGPLRDYTEERDRPDREATSFLSPHLAFGEISPRQIWHATRHAAHERKGLDRAAEKFLAEVGWREFSYHLLFHNPGLAEKNYNSRYDAFPWRDADPDVLSAWQMGRTGVPIIDAGMRELWQTGYMHNRVRMIAASYLIKNLLIDWREGERWFWDTLCDADPANNAASWQWVAGSGADAAPYFRIFNPVLQGCKFDPKGEYVRRFVPELGNLPDTFIHNPWDAPLDVLDKACVALGKTYPEPLVDLKASRQRALQAYRKTGDD
ncbi:MAG: deoxyribodipyrimidine photo-lyase [Hyphomicrobiales bacterium]|nr:deoxyribodipyrimidine photo-lyase [Hyphomicrobiales bacterium]